MAFKRSPVRSRLAPLKPVLDRVSLVSNMSTWSPAPSVLTIAASQARVFRRREDENRPVGAEDGLVALEDLGREARGPGAAVIDRRPVRRCIARRIRSGTFMGLGSASKFICTHEASSPKLAYA
jgi:hypothetical protein